VARGDDLAIRLPDDVLGFGLPPTEADRNATFRPEGRIQAARAITRDR
jgi:hypothetical protein